MKWHYILDKQPNDDTIIVQIDEPFDLYPKEYPPHYPMGMRHYRAYIPWEEYIAAAKEKDVMPHFWWMYAVDFPFPDRQHTENCVPTMHNCWGKICNPTCFKNQWRCSENCRIKK